MKTFFAFLLFLLAASVRCFGDAYWDGTDFDIFIRIDDKCESKEVEVSYTYSFDGGNPVSGSYEWNTSGGNAGIADIYPVTSVPVEYTLSYTITPVGDNANYQNVNQTGVYAGTPPYEFSQNGYTATSPNPCGAQSGENNSVTLNVTNIFSSPLQLPNGQELQPGQSTQYQWNFPLGSQSNSITFQTLNDNGQWEDGGGFTLTDGWNSAYPPSFVTATNSLPIQQQGVDANTLANGQGGIIWDNTNTSPAENSTLQAGFQALNNDELANQAALNGDFSNLVASLHNPGNPVVTSGGSTNFGGTNASGVASNVWVMNWPSNLFNGSNVAGTNAVSTNVWVQNWPTNPFSTNAILSATFANTNAAGHVLDGVASAISSYTAVMPSALGDQGGGAQEQDIQIGPSGAVTIAMGVLPASVSGSFSQVRGLIAWFVVALLLYWNFRTLFDAIVRMFSVPQGEGPDTGAWATVGGNFTTAVVVSSAIVALVSVLPVVAVGFLAGEISFFSGGSTTNPLSFFNAMGWAYQFLSQYIPIYVMFSAFGVRVVFYFAVRSFESFGSAAIKLMVGV